MVVCLLVAALTACTAPEPDGAKPAPDGAKPAPDRAPEPVTLRNGRPAMGTILEITLVAEDRTAARQLIDQAHSRVAALEARVSSWQPSSDISRLNRAAGSPVLIGADAADLLRTAQQLAAETGGSFDVSVGPLIQLWRRAAADGHAPPPERVEAARRTTGSGRIRITAESAGGAGHSEAELEAGMAIDLGGIAKGWALDRVGAWLVAQGVEHALLNFGGSSLLAIGAPPGERHWRVRVDAPERGQGVLEFADAHVSISASLGQFMVIGGERLSHVVDPRTGRPVPGGALAIVEGPGGAQAEAWSTALLVLGKDGVDRAEAAGVRVMVTDGSTTTTSDGFPAITWRTDSAP